MTSRQFAAQWKWPRNGNDGTIRANDHTTEIQDHITSTYRALRRGLAAIGVAFPLILWSFGSYWFGVPFQPSLSDYYFADSTGNGIAHALLDKINVWPPINTLLLLLAQFDSHAPMRSWFVGLLFALGALMILYRGFSNLENRLLNIAGVLAMGVALFPTGCHNCTPFNVGLHGLCAFLAFACLVLVACLCSKQTLHIEGLELPEHIVKRYERLYNVCAALMAVFPIAAVIVTYIWNWVLGGDRDAWQAHLVFFMELLGLWCFAFYWIVKSRELDESGADVHAASGRLKSTPNDLRRTGPLVVKKLHLEDRSGAAPASTQPAGAEADPSLAQA